MAKMKWNLICTLKTSIELEFIRVTINKENHKPTKKFKHILKYLYYASIYQVL